MLVQVATGPGGVVDVTEPRSSSHEALLREAKVPGHSSQVPRRIGIVGGKKKRAPRNW